MLRSPPAPPLLPRVRPLRPADAGMVRQGLAELSAETLYRRFLGHVRPSQVDLAWVEELGEPRHVAYGACAPATGEPLGLARAVVTGERAELAVTVVDRWQGRRIGTALAAALVDDLRARGVGVVVGTVSLDNRAAVALFRRLGARTGGPVVGGVVELQLRLVRGC